MLIRIFSIVFAVLAIVFGLIGIPTFLYADLETGGEVNISALVPTEEEVPEVPAVGGPGFLPDTTPPKISDIVVDNITSESAVISWKTSEPSIPQINYGKTKDYEKTIIGKDFLMSHRIILGNLSADTVYHFEIVVADRAGNRTRSGDYVFKTLVGPDILPPANVSNFEAIPGDRQITLKWQNPPDPDFKAVKIMRSEKFYPKDPWEGIIVSDGRGTSFVDTGLTNGMRYYYTAFSYDFAGNFSSGAIVSAVPRPVPPPPPEEIFTEKECLEAGYYWYDGACHRESKVIPPPPEVEKITLEDLDFIQEGKKISIIEKKIELKPKEPLTISIDYEKVPEVLKTIIVTLEKENKFFSFLLRVNKEKTAYLATLMPPEDSGIYPLTITILDYKNQALKRISSQLIVSEIEPPLIPIPWHKEYRLYIYILAGMVIAGIIYLFRKLKIKYQK